MLLLITLLNATDQSFPNLFEVPTCTYIGTHYYGAVRTIKRTHTTRTGAGAHPIEIGQQQAQGSKMCVDHVQCRKEKRKNIYVEFTRAVSSLVPMQRKPEGVSAFAYLSRKVSEVPIEA